MPSPLVISRFVPRWFTGTTTPSSYHHHTTTILTSNSFFPRVPQPCSQSLIPLLVSSSAILTPHQYLLPRVHLFQSYWLLYANSITLCEHCCSCPVHQSRTSTCTTLFQVIKCPLSLEHLMPIKLSHMSIRSRALSVLFEHCLNLFIGQSRIATHPPPVQSLSVPSEHYLSHVPANLVLPRVMFCQSY